MSEDNYRERVCPDELIGFYKVTSKSAVYETRNDYENKFVFAQQLSAYSQSETLVNFFNPIILILESPHKYEFFDNQILIFNSTEEYTKSWPANGKTGKYIRKYLAKILEKYFYEDGVYPVIAMNAVQAQCSCGRSTGVCRDKNFLDCFYGDDSNFNADSLEDRINSIGSYSAILNLCTVGKAKTIRERLQNQSTPLFFDKYSLNECVQHFLQQKEYLHLYRGPHPSSWWWFLNRKIKAIK